MNLALDVVERDLSFMRPNHTVMDATSVNQAGEKVSDLSHRDFFGELDASVDSLVSSTHKIMKHAHTDHNV